MRSIFHPHPGGLILSEAESRGVPWVETLKLQLISPILYDRTWLGLVHERKQEIR